MSKIMLINAVDPEECRIAVLDGGVLQELYVERSSTGNYVGNVYKGRVTNIEPSIQAAFVDYGHVKNGFLHISDVVPSYFPEGAKRSGNLKPPIQTVLKRGQEVIVQVTKEGIGTKGATLSTYLSIAGRFLVLMPGFNRIGVSRKIDDDEERRKLREALEDLERPKNMGIIIRTAGLGIPKTELRRDLRYLMRVWKLVSDQIRVAKCPAEIYRESDLAVRTVRDIFTTDVEKIYIDDSEAAARVREFLQAAMPRYVKCINEYTDKVPLFHKHGIEEELEKIYTRTVPLACGGHLVIDQTEALVAIDVNSGRFRSISNPEESAYRLNCEAAKEIVRQLRLRDLGGVIVMDFVDMRSEKHRRGVEDVLRAELKKDRARSRFLRTSRFGLIEMTRQRMRASLERSSFMDCPHCSGSGLIKTPESMSLDVMRQLSLAASQDNIRQIEVTVHPTVGHYINNRKRRTLVTIEQRTGKQIMVVADATVSQETVNFHCQDDRGIPARFDPHELARQQHERVIRKEPSKKEPPKKSPDKTDDKAKAKPKRRRRKAAKKTADTEKTSDAEPNVAATEETAKPEAKAAEATAMSEATEKPVAKKKATRKRAAKKTPKRKAAKAAKKNEPAEEKPPAAESKSDTEDADSKVSKSKKRRLRRKRAAAKKKTDDGSENDSAGDNGAAADAD